MAGVEPRDKTHCLECAMKAAITEYYETKGVKPNFDQVLVTLLEMIGTLALTYTDNKDDLRAFIDKVAVPSLRRDFKLDLH